MARSKTFDPIQAFWDKVEVRSLGTCWLWGGAISKNGYGTVRYNYVYKGAHVVAWEMFFGLVPFGKQLNHTCHIRNCVNPFHMYVGTQLQNLQDMWGRGKGLLRGENHPNSKLSDDDADKVRRDPRPLRQIATEYKVSTTLVSMIKNGKVRKSV